MNLAQKALEPSQAEFASYLEVEYGHQVAIRHRELVSDSNYLNAARAAKPSIGIHICKAHFPKKDYYCL